MAVIIVFIVLLSLMDILLYRRVLNLRDRLEKVEKFVGNIVDEDLVIPRAKAKLSPAHKRAERYLKDFK